MSLSRTERKRFRKLGTNSLIHAHKPILHLYKADMSLPDTPPEYIGSTNSTWVASKASKTLQTKRFRILQVDTPLKPLKNVKLIKL